MFAVAQALDQMVLREKAKPALCNFIVCERPINELLRSGWIVVNYAPQELASGRLHDPFVAIGHEFSAQSTSVMVSDEPEPKIPMRALSEPAETYTGPHGKILVIKKRR
jgi:hypothetical protein